MKVKETVSNSNNNDNVTTINNNKRERERERDVRAIINVKYISLGGLIYMKIRLMFTLIHFFRQKFYPWSTGRQIDR